jgi:hypothetical protein
MKKNILKIIFIAWLIMWALFTMRELVAKGQLKEYRTLLGLSLEGKYSHITGKELYELIALANNILPEGASYKLIGLEKGSIEKIRATYYLYPAIEKEGADYLIVYKTPGFKAEGYYDLKKLDDVRIILKKSGVK